VERFGGSATAPARRLALFLFLALLGTQAFIGPARTFGIPNVVTRIALAVAIVQDGSLRIDRFADYTIDKAERGGHFYADKAPGASLLAVPIVAALDLAWRIAGRVPDANIHGGAAGYEVFPLFFMACTWAASVLLSAVAAAVAAAAMVGLAMRLGASLPAAGRVAVAFGFGTPILWWGTTFFGHSLSAAMLLLGFSRILAGSEGEAGHERRDGLLTGALLGGAALVELIAAPAGLVIGLFGLARLRRLPRARALALLGWTALGAIPPALLLLGYNWAAFGGPFELGYGKVVGFSAMHQGLFGVSLPQPMVAMRLLVGPGHGLLWLSPFLALTPVALWVAWRRMPRDVVVVCVAVPLCFLTINAGYAYWTGGSSTGPRHLTAGLAFACLPVAALWDWAGAGDMARRRLRWVIDGLIAAALVVSFLCANVDPVSMPLPRWHSPLIDDIVPMLLRGEVHNGFTILLQLIGVPAFPPLATLAVLPLILAEAWVVSRRVIPVE
jgi:hypothetical protein